MPGGVAGDPRDHLEPLCRFDSGVSLRIESQSRAKAADRPPMGAIAFVARGDRTSPGALTRAGHEVLPPFYSPR
jgi:hypothetical protein